MYSCLCLFCLTDVSFQLQVVVVVAVVVIEAAVEHQEVAVVVEEEEAAEEEEFVEEPKEAQTLFSNLTDILVFLSLKAKTICWSPKILFPANPYMARNGYLLKVVLKARKLNIVFGILFVASWPLGSWVD